MPKNITFGKNNFGNDLLMNKTDLDVVEASGIVHKHELMLVESVAILKDYWFFMAIFPVSFTTSFRSMIVPSCQRWGTNKKLWLLSKERKFLEKITLN